MTKRITLREVGERAGVSMMTASRVLNGSSAGVRPETSERVVKAARELGYRPNAAAQAMATSRFNQVALLMSRDLGHSDLPRDMLRGLLESLAERNQHLTIATMPDEQLTSEEVMPGILRTQLADGLLINYTHEVPQEMLELIRSYQLPTIFINVKQPSDCVYPDDFRGGKEATEALLEIGRRDIVYVDYSHGTQELSRKHYSATDRQEGYAQAMKEAGLPPRVIRGDKSSVPAEQRWKFSSDWLQEHVPEAVLSYGDVSGTFVYRAALELGIEVPERLLICSIGDASATWRSGMRMPNLVVPGRAVGAVAVEMLMEKIDNPSRPLPPRPIAYDADEFRRSIRIALDLARQNA